MIERSNDRWFDAAVGVWGSTVVSTSLNRLPWMALNLALDVHNISDSSGTLPVSISN